MASIPKEDIPKTAEAISKAIPEKNRYDKPIWQGVLKLIEESEFGKKNAQSDIVSPLPEGRSETEEMMSGSFDGVQIEMMRFCNSVLGSCGSVSMEPYTAGLGTRSMTLTFEAN